MTDAPEAPPSQTALPLPPPPPPAPVAQPPPPKTMAPSRPASAAPSAAAVYANQAKAIFKAGSKYAKFAMAIGVIEILIGLLRLLVAIWLLAGDRSAYGTVGYYRTKTVDYGPTLSAFSTRLEIKQREEDIKKRQRDLDLAGWDGRAASSKSCSPYKIQTPPIPNILPSPPIPIEEKRDVRKYCRTGEAYVLDEEASKHSRTIEAAIAAFKRFPPDYSRYTAEEREVAEAVDQRLLDVVGSQSFYDLQTLQIILLLFLFIHTVLGALLVFGAVKRKILFIFIWIVSALINLNMFVLTALLIYVSVWAMIFNILEIAAIFFVVLFVTDLAKNGAKVAPSGMMGRL